ncbi:MAG: neutral/alkaline non-lysosomal ceramidase N-terminal domain-containing protein [Armatimonadetes bacterium]|nr:neutral/alkaline non-lysosomal ceramidase N-terminal domain-containing protein [Armatimonadota bacterium]
MAQLRAGASVTSITPPVGVDLSGFGFREGPSEGVHDDLFCRVLVLDDGLTRLAVAGMDLLRLKPELEVEMRQAVAAAADCRPEAVLLNCSHTHAGPDTGGLEALGTPHEEYVRTLPKLAASTAATAVDNLEPATLHYGEAPLRIGVDRREVGDDGVVRFGRNPEGIADSVVRVLAAKGQTSGKQSVLFHHACHGTALKGDNRLISADWIGAAAQSLQRDLGSDTQSIFLQGCCGQLNPDVGDNTFDEMTRIGEETAAAVKTALASSQPMEGTPLGARLARIGLPLQEPMEPAEADKLLGRRRGDVARAKSNGWHPYVVRALEHLVAHAETMVERARRPDSGDTNGLPFVVQALRIGDLGLAAMSAEVFFEFSQVVQEESHFAHTWVLAYTNGCLCYVPTPAAYAEGGYEADDSFAWYGVLPLAPTAGGRLAEVASQLLREVYEEPRDE